MRNDMNYKETLKALAEAKKEMMQIYKNHEIEKEGPQALKIVRLEVHLNFLEGLRAAQEQK